jgi:hypothetical protein
VSISVVTKITVEIDDLSLDLTKEQAENLYTALGQALNKTNTTLTYPPNVRSVPPSIVYPTPPYEITCKPQRD